MRSTHRGRVSSLRRGMQGTLLLAGGMLVGPTVLRAQHMHEEVQAKAHEHGAPGPVSAKTREQIAAVEQAVAALKTTDTLSAEGFLPVFGMIPTMGVHWVNVGRTLNEPVSLLSPANVIRSQVNGEQQIVGVAYAFVGQKSEAPDLFDGDQDVWHEHPEFTPPGLSTVMMHVWFVPSPDGPFAPHNPWLPYWAAGVEPPADSVMLKPETAARARELGLALAEAVTPLSIAQARGTSMMQVAMTQLQGGAPGDNAAALPPGVPAQRDSLQAAIPRLNAARQAGDQARWDREADGMIAIWKRVRDAYIAAVPVPEMRDRLAAFYTEMATGKHAD